MQSKGQTAAKVIGVILVLALLAGIVAVIYRFTNVKYTFDTGNTEPKDYSVKVVPNAERDFDFTVDGERYLYSKEDDLTAAFGLNKQDTYFELVIPEDFSSQYALQSCYPGQTVVVPTEAEQGVLHCMS